MAYLQKTYDYVDETYTLLFQVCRYFPKEFRQRRPDPEQRGKWLYNLDGVRRVLFRLPKVLQEKHLILLLEGEKDVEAAERLGFVATTNAMGAMSWSDDYLESLRGIETICIIADHDDAGRRGAAKKAESLQGVAKHVKVLRCLPGVEQTPGGDLSDWIQLQSDKKSIAQKLLNLIHDAPDYVSQQTSQPADIRQAIGTLDDFLSRLQGVKAYRSGHWAICPAHDDKKPSLHISERDGKILLNCKAGCTAEQIVDAMGLRQADLFLKESQTLSKQKTHSNFPQFWYEITINEGKENERQELHIDYSLFLEFLEKEGFGLLIDDKQVEIVQVKENLIDPTLKEGSINISIKQFVLQYLKHLNLKEVRELMVRRHSTFFTTAFLTSLKPFSITPYRDKQDSCLLYFKNGYCEVSKTGCQFKPYDKLPVQIWKTHVLERAYHGKYSPDPLSGIQEEQSTFAKFLSLLSVSEDGQGNLIDNYAAFCYAFAFLVHDYKDQANARAVIAVDEHSTSHEANGGTGKSLFCQAIKQLRRMGYEDGKTLKMDSNFLFQSIDLDSQIILVDDVRHDFDFSQFYPAITGDMAIERKGRNRFILPFQSSPKFVFTTNYALLENGESHQRRWFILPFNNYFHLGHTPLNEFGKRLFEEWDDQEWQRFYDFTIDCLIEYFKTNKPVQADLGIYNESKFLQNLPEELQDYFGEWLAVIPCEIQRKYFFKGFRDAYPNYSKSTQRWFSRKFELYCQHHHLEINAGYSDRVWRTDADGKRYEVLIITKEGETNGETQEGTQESHQKGIGNETTGPF